MNWRMAKQRVSAMGLAAALAVSCAVPAAAAPIGDGVEPTYDEAYYATLDYYGNLLEGSVVKSYALNGKDSLTDYGVYDEVVNLTDGTSPVSGEGGATSFRFGGSAPDHFYFEGKTKQPFEDLPWTLSLRYTLNGVPMKAEDLAGKQGVVEILLDIVPNEKASDYARYNYTLEAMALFNQDDILSLEAPGAQVQLVGNLRTVLFLALPGEEQHFTIRVGSDDFSFGGLTVLMVPATLAQLEEIAKLSQRKDDLEEDYRALSGSLDNLLDALSDIQNGLYASAKGLDQLEAARQSFSGGKGVLYDGTDRLRGDLSNLAELLGPVEQRIQLLSQTVTDSKTVLNDMTDAALTLQTQLKDMEDALWGLENGSDDLKHVIDLAADMKNSLLRLERALGGTHTGGSSVSTNSGALVQKVKTVHGVYAEKDRDAFFAQMLALQGKSAGEIQDIQTILGLDEATAAAIGKQQEWQAAQQAKQQMDGLHAMKENGMSFQGFCESLPGVSESQAKQMNDLWLIYSSGDVTGETKPAPPETPPEQEGQQLPAMEKTPSEAGEEAGEIPVSESENEPEEEELSPGKADREQMTARLTLNAPGSEGETDGGDASDGDASDGDASDGDASGGDASGGDASGGDTGSGGSASPDSGGSGSGEDSEENNPPDQDDGSGADGEPGEEPDTGGGSDTEDTPGTGENPGGTGGSDENNTVGGAVVDLITGGLDNATAQIDRIQSQLTDTLEEIKRPTAVVVGDLADLCGELDSLISALDDAEDLASALRQSSMTLREILGDVDALRTVLNGYEPTLQEALSSAGALSTAAVSTIRDTETLLADAENLARSTGRDLDAGTRQSLNGLSAALRQTAKALAATGEVKDAKNTVADIIEDTWNEYTGDVNNLLLMDATAEPVSLTDERNPTPSSVQVLIRTQEIKEEEPEETPETAEAKTATTFWGRVGQMFRDFWNAVTGIFH